MSCGGGGGLGGLGAFAALPALAGLYGGGGTGTNSPSNWMGAIGQALPGIVAGFLPSTGKFGLLKGGLTAADMAVKDWMSRIGNQGMMSFGQNLLAGGGYDETRGLTDTLGVMAENLPPDLYGRTMTSIDEGTRTDVQDFINNMSGVQAGSDAYFGNVGNANARLASALRSKFSNVTTPLKEKYAERYTRGMGYLEGMGEQERADIEEQYDALNAATQGRLGQMGLTNSTLGASMESGNERERRGALNRLAEDVAQMKLSADASLSGDELAALERFGGAELGMEEGIAGRAYNTDVGRYSANQDILNRTNFGKSEIESAGRRERRSTDLALTGDILNFATSPTVGYPDAGLYAQMGYSGGYASKPYEPPGFWDTWGMPLMMAGLTEGMMLPFQLGPQGFGVFGPNVSGGGGGGSIPQTWTSQYYGLGR